MSEQSAIPQEMDSSLSVPSGTEMSDEASWKRLMTTPLTHTKKPGKHPEKKGIKDPLGQPFPAILADSNLSHAWKIVNQMDELRNTGKLMYFGFCFRSCSPVP